MQFEKDTVVQGISGGVLVQSILASRYLLEYFNQQNTFI